MNKSIQIMGILNCTPDSFYDGGKYGGVDGLIRRGIEMASAGADLIDVGSESTRPGAKAVDAETELKRLLPVITGICQKSKIPLSVDTRKAAVAHEAILAGASMVNDVSGLTFDGEMIPLVEKTGVKIVIMHSRGDPETMQKRAEYDDVVSDVLTELKEKVERALNGGVRKDQILIDPGFGFAKTAEQNWALLKNLGSFAKLGYPLMVGLSRKSFLGSLTGQSDPSSRLPASLAAALLAVQRGADILRVHDVRETKEAIKVLKCVSLSAEALAKADA